MSQPTIAIQGMPGAYTEQAAQQLYGPDANLLYLPTFEEVFAALRSKDASTAVVAIANVNIGFIPEPHQELVASGGTYFVNGETHVAVHHQLLGMPGASIADIKHIHSMAPALEQSARTLHHLLPHAEIIEEADTALGAQRVRELQDPSHAAVASVKAGELNGLKVIKADVQDKAKNITRFLSLTLRRQGVSAIDGSENKTTMLLDVPERQGALFKSLAPFWLTGTNITTLHSSFVEESDFTERFFIEFEAGVQARKTKFILAALRKLGAETTILGSYRRNEAYHKTKGVMA